MRSIALAITVLALGACAHAPRRAAAIPAAPIPAAVPAAGPAAPAPAAPAGEAAPAAPDNADASAVAPVAGPSPEQYGDLFDRMRVGFKLDDADGRAAVDQQLRWYAGNPAYLERAFGRADLYLYHIVTELERRGMPLELALLPVVESAFEPYAYSRASASGLWQFIPGTGSQYGLRQDWWYDGRRDIVESTRAALDYLQSLHDEFNGDWLLAIAAYNCGEAAVERAVAANRYAGRPVDFWSLRLPRETRAYVPKLLAMKRLVANPATYGLSISPIPNQPYFVRVATYSQMNLKLAAQIAGITPEEVYELNPAFHRWATDPAGPFYLLLPQDAADVFGQNITQLTPDQRLGVTHHTVERGDSVASVARQYQTTVKLVRELNDMPTGGIAVGDDLRVPSAVPDLPPKVMLAAARADGAGRSLRHRRLHVRVQVVRRGESLWSIARRHGMNVNALASLNGMQPGDRLRAGQRIRLTSGAGSGRSHARHGKRRVIYTVRTGDTVSQIARLFQCSVPQLLAWNGLPSGSRLHAGQKLRIHFTPRSG
ncbi:MAG: LysM peptidoglycan-binding domain-containing protein [Proteobacteria bacterium]|nr:LysM peptidoglycan-binding domain-containing protein [Pseudomonadota bacterium]